MALLHTAVLLGMLLLVIPAKRFQKLDAEDRVLHRGAKPSDLATSSTQQAAQPSSSATEKADVAASSSSSAAAAAAAAALAETGVKAAVVKAAAQATEAAAEEVVPAVENPALSVHEIYVANHDGLQVYESCGSTHIVGYLEQGQQVAHTDDIPCTIATIDFLPIDGPNGLRGFVQLSHLRRVLPSSAVHEKAAAGAAEASKASALTEAEAKAVVADTASPAKAVIPAVQPVVEHLSLAESEPYVALHEGLPVYDTCGSTQIVAYLKKDQRVWATAGPHCTLAGITYLPIVSDIPDVDGGVVQLSHLQITLGGTDEA